MTETIIRLIIRVHSLSRGRDGIHSIAHWKAEIRHALENQTGKYMSNSSSANAEQTNYLESHTRGTRRTTTAYFHSVDSGDPLHPFPGLKADVPDNADTTRSSMANLNTPLSTAFTVTFFELEAALPSGPQAENTPPNTLTTKLQPNQRLHTLEKADIKSNTRRSSIVYIRSDNHEFTS
jgi:hypothetical protein